MLESAHPGIGGLVAARGGGIGGATMRTDRNRRIAAFPMAVLFPVLVAVACGGGPPSGEAGSGPSARRDATRIPRPAPGFELRNLEGGVVRLSDTAGKVRLVDFWATWCAPCREAIPDFKDLHARYREHGFEIIAISMDEEGPSVVRPWVEREGIPYTIVMGSDEVGEAFGGVLGLPTAFLVDREGQIVASWVGSVPKRVFEEKIREALGLGPA